MCLPNTPTGDEHTPALIGGDFGEALHAMRTGARVTRDGWGPGRYVVIQKGYPTGIPINENTANATGLPVGTVCAFRPYLMISSLDGFEPWAPTATDVLADDWKSL